MLSGTDVSQKSLDLEKMRLGALGRCRQFFWLGVAFDAVGVAVLFTGVFANLLFYDMLLYLGSIIIFVSLLWWISWYTGNIEALPEDPLRRTSPRVGEVSVHRCGSRRFSLTLRSVSNTFQLIRRRRRQRLLPRVLQRVSNMSSPDPGHMDARTAGACLSFR
ncbi:transmembrane protein 238-like isoform X2 [Meriones unguiculatus]|uniref:transmembrane protein 238-like isoform X2 n=1 Tax=Meriones unguiculatus TaxID=10047 RepID=UPI000B4EF2FF|nr:transmembrane protein 238-like isoform X2 [Meriones unguiculatus]